MSASVSSQTAGSPSALSGPRAEGELRLEPEPRVRLADLAHEPLDLGADLLGPHEDVGVVGDEVADPGQPRQHARQLVPVEHAVLGQAERQLAIRADAAAVDERRLRAVHRLEAEGLALGLEQEHVLAVVLPVARALPERLAARAAACRSPGSRAAPGGRASRRAASGRASSPSDARRRPPARRRGTRRGRAGPRACGGRASSPPRAATGSGRAPPASPRPCRRSAAAPGAPGRRASRRRPRRAA